MFNRKKQEKAVIVTTKEELRAAVKRKEACIEVHGDLAKQLKWMKKLSPAKIAALITLLGCTAIPSPIAPISAVVSLPAVTAITGSQIAAIIFAGGLSAAMILAIFKGYTITIVVKDGHTIVTLTKKS